MFEAAMFRKLIGAVAEVETTSTFLYCSSASVGDEFAPMIGGEIVAKSAYGDWTRATEYGRSMSQHAIHMIQRNLTPGGDKNGADITMALDALEMAFTHDHINAFVIVGGDSDFISLVEKLKRIGAVH